MGRRCKNCLALLGICLVSCRARADAHDHAGEVVHSEEEHEHAAGTDFVSFLAAESPEAHVQHVYEESGASSGIYSWMIDAASHSACGLAGVVDAVTGEQSENDHGEDGHGEDEHAGHAHRRMLEDHADADEHSDHEHAAHEHDEDHNADEAAARVLTVESLEALGEGPVNGTDAVKQALSYITACLVDPNCVLEGASAIRAAASEDDHDVHDDHDAHGHDSSGASKYIGLKVGLAVAFFVLTVAASYLPLVFMFSRHYEGILACLNTFSGSTFLSVGILHLLPHVADYETMADIDTDFPVGLSLVIVGFLLVLLVEQVVFNVHGADDGAAAGAARVSDGPNSSDKDGKGSTKGDSVGDSEVSGSIVEQAQALWQKYHSPLITEAAVVLHAVLESMVLGLSGTKHNLWLLFWAVASHKGFTAMSQATRFLRLGCPPGLLFFLLSPFHILPPLGVILGTVSGGEDAVASLVLAALATGTFIYIGAFEVISEEFGGHSHGDAAPAAATALASGDVEGATHGIDQPVVPEARSDWSPSRMVKFLVFVFGCGVMYAVTAALPPHDELHGH